MGGLARFLLGGVLGAGLGFLISRKQSQRIQKVVQPVSSPRETPAAIPWAPSAPVAAVVPDVSSEPEVEAVCEVAPLPLEPELAPPLALEPELVPASSEPPEFEALMAEVATEPEVVVTPELLEEPLPGAGWEPSAVLADEEQAFEEILPLVPDEIVPEDGLPYAAEAVVEGDSEPEPDLMATAEVETSAGPIAADDLRTRIEETRRRIRRELEEPFMAAGAGVVAEEMMMAPSPEPVIGEALIEQPSVDGGQAPPAEDSRTPLADGSSFPGVAEGGATHAEPASELGVDLDAMRSRIESTRNRLKAKAFDAMMAGESALLGRDSADTGAELPAPTDVDNEIFQTIELTLREEED